MNTLPNEILRIILGYANYNVTRFVSTEWRDNYSNNNWVYITNLIPYNNLDLLVWARNNGCPWGYCCCYEAASYGYIEILKWLRVNNQDWGEDIIFIAGSNGQFETIEWMKYNGCPYEDLSS